ncbi:MAG TPA: DUF3828 domain-containing protein [Chthoniobacterales bacterium]|jgi:hypothetical protein
MKLLLLVLSFALAVIAPSNVYSAEEKKVEATPEVQITKFYAWYVKAVDAGKDPLSDNVSEMQKFVTKELLAKIEKDSSEGMDADYFLNAQDVDPTWAKGITVKNLKVKENSATADVQLSGKGFGISHLKLSLRLEKGAWKIDKVAVPGA